MSREIAIEFKDNSTRAYFIMTNFSSSNNSSNATEKIEEEMHFAEVCKLTFQVLIALFGVIGNVLVILVIRRLKKEKRAGDFYVQNLAIADLGILAVIFPLSVLKEKAPLNWPFGEFTCRYLYPVPEIFYGASIWFIAVIAVERYRKVTMATPVGQNKIKRFLQKPTTVAASVWLISFLIFCVPLYFVVEYHEYPNGGKRCGPDWPSWALAFYVGGTLTFVSWVLPLIVISFTYLRISRLINRSTALVKDMKQNQDGEKEGTEFASMNKIKCTRLKQNKRAMKIITPLVLVFAITMLPVNILRLTVVFWPAVTKQAYYQHLFYAIGVFVILNSSTNPLIYSVVSRDFRQRVTNLCFHSGRMRYSFSLSGIILRLRSRSSSLSRSRRRSRSRATPRNSGHR